MKLAVIIITIVNCLHFCHNMNPHDNETIPKKGLSTESIPLFFSRKLSLPAGQGRPMMMGGKRNINLDLVNGVCARHFLASISSDANYIFELM